MRFGLSSRSLEAVLGGVLGVNMNFFGLVLHRGSTGVCCSFGWIPSTDLTVRQTISDDVSLPGDEEEGATVIVPSEKLKVSGAFEEIICCCGKGEAENDLEIER